MIMSAKELGEFLNLYDFDILFNKSKIKSKFTVLEYI